MRTVGEKTCVALLKEVAAIQSSVFLRNHCVKVVSYLDKITKRRCPTTPILAFVTCRRAVLGKLRRLINSAILFTSHHPHSIPVIAGRLGLEQFTALNIFLGQTVRFIALKCLSKMVNRLVPILLAVKFYSFIKIS